MERAIPKIYEIPGIDVEVKNHLENKSHYYCVKTNEKHKINQDAKFHLSWDWSSMVLGRPEPYIYAMPGGCVWVKTIGYCKTE